MTRPLPPPLLIRLLVILNYDTYVTAYSESFPFYEIQKSYSLSSDLWFILNCWSNYKVSLRFIIASLFIIATKRLKYDMIFFLSKKQHVQIIRKKWPNLTCVYCRWVLKHNFFWKDLFISVGVCTEKVHNSLAQFPHSKKKPSMNSLIRICSFGFRWHFEGKKNIFFTWIEYKSEAWLK